MSLIEWFGVSLIKRMTPEERNDFIEMAIKEMIASMSSEERKNLMIRLLPEATKAMLDGMTPEDRKKVVETVAPTLLFQLSASGALSGITDLLRIKKEDKV